VAVTPHMSRDQVDTWLERGIVGLVLGILVYGPLAFGGVRPAGFLVLLGLTVMLVVLWLARLWIKPSLHLLWPPVCWWVLAWGAYAMARYWAADVEYPARLELGRILLYTLLFLVCVTSLYRQGASRAVVYGLTLVAVIESGWAVYQFVTRAGSIWGLERPEVYLNRGSGTYLCPNHLAGFLEMILPMSLAYAVAGRGRIVTRLVLGYAALVITAGIAFSLSRAGWLAAATGLLLLLMLLARTARQWLALGISVATVLAVGLVLYLRSPSMQLRVEDLRGPIAAFKTDVRYGLYQAAFKMWQDHPWFGVGPAHYDVRFRAYRPEGWQYQLRPELAHNDYLNALADWGLIGAALIAGTLGSVGWTLGVHWRRLRRARKDQPRDGGETLPFVAGATAALGALMVHSAWDFNLHIPANAIVAVVLLALLAAHVRFGTDRYWVTAGFSLRLGLSLLLAGALAWLMVTGVRFAREQRWLREAERHPVLTREHLQALERAFAAEPANADTARRIGEQYRWLSLRGQEGYREEASLALDWFRRAATINPFDPYARTGAGACLHWLDRPEEAAQWFEAALSLDPNGYQTRALMGWHYFSSGNYRMAREWFEKSLLLHNHPDNLSRQYLPLTLERLAEPGSATSNK